MSIRTGIARAVGGLISWGLRNVAHRPAGNFPGKVAEFIDPGIVRELRYKMTDGIIVVVGTNGKTTVTNMLADALEQSGKSVICNRTGANLRSGIASTLMQAKSAQWGVLESDELWLAKVLPDLQADYVLLLNLFRDQLDRCGEIDIIQESIIGALNASPSTMLIYNADDPLCTYIATMVSEIRKTDGLPEKTMSFGCAESMNLAQNVVADATMCQICSSIFEYDFRQYGQLGSYKCPKCGFSRPMPEFVASGIDFAMDGLSFDVTVEPSSYTAPNKVHLHAALAGSYMVYNLLAVYSAATMANCSCEDVQRAIDAFDPKNGRLQSYVIDGRNTLLNLAKNPTGFNQNLRIVEAYEGPKAAAFFINDQVVDGHDISWIWDIDFEELAKQDGLVVFAGGRRKNDLQVRLKYAGVKAQLIDSVADMFEVLAGMSERGEFPADAPAYAIANYSALPPVKATLDEMAREGAEGQQAVSGENVSPHVISTEANEVDSDTSFRPRGEATSGEIYSSSMIDFSIRPNGLTRNDVETQPSETPIVIVHMLPELLNLYGDGGNVRILGQRLKWRGIPFEIKRVHYGQQVDLDDADLLFLGGGPDREQTLAAEVLINLTDDIKKFIDEGGPVLAICGGYQILGRTWLLGEEEVPGLGVIGVETRRPGTSSDRLVDNITLKSRLAEHSVVGYENHASRTYLDADVEPFGEVISRTGKGNTDEPENGKLADGAIYKNVIGTYLHGTLLSKNPEIADWLLERALERHSKRTGEPELTLSPLDDSEEFAANAFMS